MDDISGLGDKFNDFANFLTISRKFGYICLYILHIIYPTKSIWQMILSQTKNFNVFPSTIQLGNILKMLISNCDRGTIGCISARDLWINQLYMSLSKESKHAFLTIAKYRTSAESNFEKFCYFVQNKKDAQSTNPLDFKTGSVIRVARKQ